MQHRFLDTEDEPGLLDVLTYPMVMMLSNILFLDVKTRYPLVYKWMSRLRSEKSGYQLKQNRLR